MAVEIAVGIPQGGNFENAQGVSVGPLAERYDGVGPQYPM